MIELSSEKLLRLLLVDTLKLNIFYIRLHIRLIIMRYGKAVHSSYLNTQPMPYTHINLLHSTIFPQYTIYCKKYFCVKTWVYTLYITRLPIYIREENENLYATLLYTYIMSYPLGLSPIWCSQLVHLLDSIQYKLLLMILSHF